jgi:hypothetical protein
MQTTGEIDLRRYPPTPDDLAAGFGIAGRDIAPAIQRAEDEYGQTAPAPFLARSRRARG